MLVGDYLLGSFVQSATVITAFQSVKGVVFIALSSMLIAVLLHREEKQRRVQEKAQQRLIAILEATSDLVSIADAQHKVLYLNAAGRQFLHVPSEEPLEFALEANHPAWAVQLIAEQGLPTAIKEGIWTGETAILTRNGEEIPMSQVIMAHHNEQGNVEYFSTIARDVRAQRQTEEKIRRSEALLAEAQELARLGNWEWNVIDDSLTWSDQMYRIFGLLMGQPLQFTDVLEQVHPDDRDLLDYRLYKADAVNEARHRVLWPDGEVRFVHVKTQLQNDDSGQLVRLFGTCQDVTEQHLVEEALRLSEERFRSLVSAASQIVWRTSADGTHIEAPDWQKFTGLSPDSMHNGGWLQALHPDDTASVEAAWQNALKQKKSYCVELRLRSANGTYEYFEARVVPLLDAQNNIREWIGMTVNINERKQAEMQLQQMADKLKLRNNELQDFAYIASHDLQEPLRKVQMFGDLLNEEFGSQLGDRGSDYIRRMRSSAARMQTLISDLLNLSRVATQGQDFLPVDLDKVLEDVLSDLEFVSQQQHVQFEVTALPVIEADATQMRQLFQNLISNAIKFHRPDVAPLLHISAEKAESSGQCRIVVEDNSIGFDSQYAERIFLPFQRLHTRQDYSGSGMGLAICRKIIERHNGQIYAQSTLGQGSRFIITLPLKQNSS